MTSDLAARLAQVCARIARAARASGRDEDSVTLVAVSKGQSAAAMRALAQLGARHFGESYLQEALAHIRQLAGLELTWHFIGRLQANKTRAVAENFSWVHALDRLRIAERLNAQRPVAAPPLNVCLQIKLAADPAKGGVDALQARELASGVHALPRLRLRGLMCMLPEGLSAPEQLAHFTAVRQLRDELNASGAQLDMLSMGMSGDYPLAIEAGATLVRIGTALFGPRP
ncbi:MAG: YggS family pyridoxal phosphate-dependent enzyme [Steroidobacteraceae bacterium]